MAGIDESRRGWFTHPFRENVGRIVFGLWYGLGGAVLLAGVALRLRSDGSGMTGGSLAVIPLAALMIAAGAQAARGRLALAAVLAATQFGWMILSRILVADPAAAPTSLEGQGAAAGAAVSGLGLIWVAARRRAARGGGDRPLGIAAWGFALGGAAFLPIFAAQIGQGLGLVAVPPPAVPSPGAGQILPSLAFRDPDGAVVRPDERGVLYVINFWATWCGPCLQELPELLRVSRSWPENGRVRLLAVCTEDLGAAAQRSFLEGRGLQELPVYSDPTNSRDPLGVNAIPTTLLVRDGRILERLEGYSPRALEELEVRIEQEISGARTGAGGAKPAGEMKTPRPPESGPEGGEAAPGRPAPMTGATSNPERGG